MRTIYKTIVAATALLLSLTACSDFLKEKNPTAIDREQVFSDDVGAWGALMSIYSSITVYNAWGWGRHLVLDITSGIYTSGAGSPNANQANLINMNITPTNQYIANLYPVYCSSVNLCNDVIAGVSESKALSDSVRTKATGDASFMRAFLYFDMVRMWGKIPMPLKQAEGPFPKSSIIDIYTQILADLQTAIDNLSPYKGKDNPLIAGHPCIYTAYALRAKVYVAMACVAENPGEPFDATGFGAARDYWQKAYDDALYVVEHGNYTLTPSLTTLFDLNNRYGDESLFEFTFNTVKGDNQLNLFFLPGSNTNFYGRSLSDPATNDTSISTGSNNNMIVVTKEFFDLHQARYPGDPRINATYIHTRWFSNSHSPTPGQQTNIYPQTIGTGANSFPYCKKHLDYQADAVQSSKNFVVLRYADVLLTLAEAANEIDRPTGEIFGYVNQVLDRARNSISGATQPADWDDATPDLDSKEGRRAAILQERLFELHGEGSDFFETRRKGLAHFQDLLKAHNYRIRYGTGTWNPTGGADGTGAPVNSRDVIFPEDANFALRNMLLPISQDELNNNPYVKENNFGY